MTDSAAHALLVKETGTRSRIPKTNLTDKGENANTLPTSNAAPGKKPFEKKKDWKDTRRELIYALPPSPSLTPTDSNLLLVTLSSFLKETSVKAQVEALLDTGSLAAVKFKFTPFQTNSNVAVCSGSDNTC